MDNNLDNKVVEIRMKYAEDLEEILECPVCYELPKAEILMCMQGHHMCSSCVYTLINLDEPCPICRQNFSTCRNYAAESICSKFEAIKNSILNPRHGSNRRVSRSRLCVSVQTEFDALYDVQRSQVNEENVVPKDEDNQVTDNMEDDSVNKPENVM